MVAKTRKRKTHIGEDGTPREVTAGIGKREPVEGRAVRDRKPTRARYAPWRLYEVPEPWVNAVDSGAAVWWL